MKRQLGISRNKIDRLVAVKNDAQRKKNRFQIVGKEDIDDYNSIQINHAAYTLTTSHSDPASQAELADDLEENTKRALELHVQARKKMSKVTEIRK